MKKLFIVLLLISTPVFAQYALKNGAMQLNAGIGFSSWGLPVYAGLDFGVHKDISVGAEVSYRSYGEDWGNSKFNHTIIGISGNANYHFNNILQVDTKWDLYAGLNIGFYNWSSPGGYGGSGNSGLGIGAQVGGRYYFSNNLGLNLEFGGGNSFSGGKFGISYIF
ncbi:hypothetical protein MTYM_00743 [Methylococcales bacterium]|nr:hypothetical protein MTYM_00743 [Methylococcales bacterium]